MKRLAVLSLLLAGCGKVESELPDAPPSADAPIDAPGAPVSVTVLSFSGDGAPNPTAKVVFTNADGTVTLDTQVDAEGKATGVLPNGGSITAIMVSADTAEGLSVAVVTVNDVQPGEDVTIGDKRRPTITNEGGLTSMTANYTPVTGASNHVFYTACGLRSGGVNSPVTLSFRDSCHGATFDLLAVTSGLTPPRYVRVIDVVHENEGSFTVPGGFSTMPSFALTTTNVPDALTSMTVTRSSMIDHQAVAPQTVSLGDPGVGTVVTQIPYAPGIGPRSEITYTMSRADVQNNSLRHDVHTAALTSSATVDFAALEVPWVTNATWTSTGATWSPIGSGTPDGQLVQWAGRWTTTRPVVVAWRVYGAYDPAGMTLPRLPAAYKEMDPREQGSVTPVQAIGMLVSYDTLDGYKDFRLQPDALIEGAPDDVAAFAGMAFQRRINQISFTLP